MFKSITNRLIINKFFPDKPKIDYELETKYNLFTNTIFIMHHGKKLLSFHPNLKYRSSPKYWCKLNSANLSFHKLKHTGFF